MSSLGFGPYSGAGDPGRTARATCWRPLWGFRAGGFREDPGGMPGEVSRAVRACHRGFQCDRGRGGAPPGMNTRATPQRPLKAASSSGLSREGREGEKALSAYLATRVKSKLQVMCRLKWEYEKTTCMLLPL